MMMFIVLWLVLERKKPLQLAGAGVELEVFSGRRLSLPEMNKKATEPRKLQDLAGRMPGQAKWPAKECVTIHCEHTINKTCLPEEKGWETKLKEARNGSINREK
ncbi:MAG: hypothetical protein IKK79_01155 [Spirochaetaceae bacterium]|nr:hypothetical protein [Spirochaetaceae bacterium]